MQNLLEERNVVQLNNNKRLYRVMSEKEVKTVKATGVLRGGKEGETFFTDSYYKDSGKAKNRLSLPVAPTHIMEFEITNNPVIRAGTKVKPEYGGVGGGREYYSSDIIKVTSLSTLVTKNCGLSHLVTVIAVKIWVQIHSA